jgi:DNA-binding PadR family transcriptional regulator
MDDENARGSWCIDHEEHERLFGDGGHFGLADHLALERFGLRRGTRRPLPASPARPGTAEEDGQPGLDYRTSIYHSSSMARQEKPLPSASLHIVLALLDGECHGYALIGRVAELSDGAVRMGPGTLYGTLNRLVDDGLIEETTDRVPRDDSERRRYYTLTASGHAVAVDELVRLQGLVHRIAAHLPGGATA